MVRLVQKLTVSSLAGILALSIYGCSGGSANAVFTNGKDLTKEQALLADTNSSLVVNPETLAVEIGKSSQIAAIFNQAGTFQTGAPVTWVSLNPDIATVDANGNVTGLKLGTATIKASTFGKEAAAVVNVTLTSTQPTAATGAVSTSTAPPAATNNQLTTQTSDAANANNPELAKLRTIEIKQANEAVPGLTVRIPTLNEARQFEATAKDAEGQKLSTLTFTWTSSNEEVAKVNSTGVVTALKTGVTNLVATAGNVQSNTIVIEVQPGTINARISFTE